MDKFAWDAKKHDDNAPEKPVQRPLYCPNCGGSNFAAIHAISETIMGNVRAVGFEKPQLALCLNCGKPVQLGALTRERKESNVTPFAKPTKDQK